MTDNDKPEQKENGTGPEVYLTKTGYEVKIKGISPLLMEKISTAYEKECPKPEKPTYRVPTAGGKDEVHDHDESTLRTEDDRLAWNKYTTDLKLWSTKQQERILKALVVKGLEFDMPEDDTWIEEQKLFGLGDGIPDKPLDRKVYFFETEVIGSLDDMMTLLGQTMGVAGFDEEVASIAQKMFQANI